MKLILAHMAGDFLLQPNSWVKAKEERKLRAYQLYLHVLVHGVLVMLMILDWAFLKWAVLLALGHLVIDVLKLLVQKKETKRTWFFVDQVLHILFICAIFCWYNGYTELDTSVLHRANNVLLITLLVFLTVSSSVITKMFIAKWSPHTGEGDDESLEDAGKYIGILERLFVFVFVISNNWEALGFLIAAKSIFRFGDLKESKERKLTEYILIGTLLSFGIAILTGLAYKALLI